LFLTKEIVFGSDGDFSWGRFDEKYNVDLANNLGNLVSRVTAMAERYRHGRLAATPVAERFTDTVTALTKRYVTAMDELSLDVACQMAFRVVDAANEYIAASEPWALAKGGRDEALDQVLWTAAEGTRLAAVLLSPVMPGSAEAILERLDAPVRRTVDLRLLNDGKLLSSGVRQVRKGNALWPRLDAGSAAEPTKETRVTELPKDIPNVPPPAPPGPATPAVQAASAADTRLSIDEFMKIELRVARILTAERVPNSKKLMKIEIELGAERRTIVAGIAEAYEAETLVGRHVAVVANLKPAKLMGVESNGMLLAASPEGGKPILLSFDGEVATGTRIR
jgi:methionyl-tRNA synthetase